MPAAAATAASRLGRRWAATETRGRTRWRPVCGCSTCRRFPGRSPWWLTTVINWPWSTEGSPPCRRHEACCRSTTGPCPCPSGQASIQRREGNPAASHYPETVGSTPSWPPPPRHRSRENPSIIAWSGQEILVRQAQSSDPKKYSREQNIASQQNGTMVSEANQELWHLHTASFRMIFYWKRVLTQICILVIPSSHSRRCGVSEMPSIWQGCVGGQEKHI